MVVKGFGSFGISERKARTGRNPRTGETLQIPASKSVSFKAAKALKDAVNYFDLCFGWGAVIGWPPFFMINPARRNLYGRHSGRPLRPNQTAAYDQIMGSHGLR